MSLTTKKNHYLEQSATLLSDQKQEKSNKEIVNKFLLSKLWYIGQIYTIPKFIKKQIEKTIRNSLWNKKNMTSKTPS